MQHLGLEVKYSDSFVGGGYRDPGSVEYNSRKFPTADGMRVVSCCVSKSLATVYRERVLDEHRTGAHRRARLASAITMSYLEHFFCTLARELLEQLVQRLGLIDVMLDWSDSQQRKRAVRLGSPRTVGSSRVDASQTFCKAWRAWNVFCYVPDHL